MTRSEPAPEVLTRRDVSLKARAQGSQAALLGLLTLGALVILLPFAWMILTAFKTPAEAYTWPPVWLPARWSVANFTQLFNTIPFARMFFNSVWTSVLIASLNILSAAPAAYAFARLRFPGQGLWFGSHLLSLMIPWQVTIIPVFLLIRYLGWYDSFTALIVPSIASGFTVFLLFQFFRSLPRSLEESVLIDGGSWFTALRHVALPAAKGAIAAAWLFSLPGQLAVVYLAADRVAVEREDAAAGGPAEPAKPVLGQHPGADGGGHPVHPAHRHRLHVRPALPHRRRHHQRPEGVTPVSTVRALRLSPPSHRIWRNHHAQVDRTKTLLFLAALSLSAASAATTIDYATWDGTRQKADEALIAAFNKSHPDIRSSTTWCPGACTGKKPPRWWRAAAPSTSCG